ncbi:iron complex transport system permease protein [Lipingzhangella halophila]|uniref:Iron complex transport system permease protein n=1 Tax=Lipingzhangella halophila TaxID=1783352 RepID=A0A7W7RKD8_9ACTN|nr:iron ABC transporter permease [Lipingzhangella halophila]MBB4933561.1 iron complex transport system permease protein [Lipingzhangella halophila]
MRRRWAWLGGALAVLAAAMLAGVTAGVATISPSDILSDALSRLPLGVTSPLDEREAAVLVQLRLPRVVLGALVGGLLAAAGAAYQGVFRNPLSDPYLLGAASGAGLGATIVMVYGNALVADPGSLIPAAAFAGALLGVTAAWTLGSAAGGGSTAGLVLAGVAVSSFLSAIQTFIQMTRIENLQRIYAWVFGGLARGGWGDVWGIAPYAVVSVAVLLGCGFLLDLLALGDEKARSLGVNATAARLTVVAAASLATAAAVSVSGLIGFVGIVVPHMVRRLVGTGYRLILPMSLVSGAAFLVLVDIAARTVIAPAELPLGVVTAFLGAPFFLVILRTTRNRGT